ncbi:MAG: LapA family protein [Desulfobacterales bacterium]
MISYFKAILLLIVLIALVTFGIQNNDPIQLHYYFQLSSMQIPIYGIVYASILIGIFIGMLVGISNRFAQRKKLGALQKENRDLKAKVGETPEAESVVESVAEEAEISKEAAEEVKDAPEAKNEKAEEEEEEEEEKETRF